MATGWNLDHSYAQLPEIFFSKLPPSPATRPQVVILNAPLARELGLDPEMLAVEAAQTLSGVALPDGAKPLAQAYAGHQYGHFTILGDGRALLLGEQVDPMGRRWDIQLKGSGSTPYSRRGDGRAALGPMLREYLISEAMFALGIPTTRSLAVVATGQPVFRETALPGAVLTRVAASHIRVGTFEYASARGPEALRKLTEYVIQRHYPEAQRAQNPVEALLESVIRLQARLMSAWMCVGFVHGVMNTDNMAIAGETIDYGPCAFMDRYDPATVFSSIDQHGRYAYGNQPAIAHWNLTRFAESLLPLLDADEGRAIEIAKVHLERFGRLFSEHWLDGMRAKLGLFEADPSDESLIGDLLAWMHSQRADFTNTFRALATTQNPSLETGKALESDSVWSAWKARWEKRLAQQSRSRDESSTLMQRSSPNIIPRNHHVEAALTSAVNTGDLTPFHAFLRALQRPFETLPEHEQYRDPAPADGEHYQTFCGT